MHNGIFSDSIIVYVFVANFFIFIKKNSVTTIHHIWFGQKTNLDDSYKKSVQTFKIFSDMCKSLRHVKSVTCRKLNIL
jgi:hypothetical protein